MQDDDRKRAATGESRTPPDSPTPAPAPGKQRWDMPSPMSPDRMASMRQEVDRMLGRHLIEAQRQAQQRRRLR